MPVKNEQSRIKEALDGIMHLDYPSYEVIVVDGGSTDSTIEILRKYPVHVLIRPGSLRGKARNIGIRYSKYKIVAFTDGDCIPPRNWLKNAIRLFRDSRIAGVGGPTLPYKKSTSFSTAIFDMLATPFANAGSSTFARHNRLRAVRHIPSSNAIYRKDVLEHVGGYPEDLNYCEDVELNYKIVKRGFSIIYSPDVVMRHYWKVDSLSSLLSLMFRYGVGRAIAIRRYPHLFSAVTLAPTAGILLFTFLTLFTILQPTHIPLLELFTSIYLIASYLSSAHFQARRPRLILVSPLVFALIHVGYGLGFLCGLVFKERVYRWWKI